MPKLLSLSKLTLLSIAFALLIVGIGGVTIFQFRKITMDDGPATFAGIEMIWALLVFLSYRFVFGHIAPSDVPKMQLHRLGVAFLVGGFTVGFVSQIVGFLILLLSTPTVTFWISLEASIYSLGAAFGTSRRSQ